MSEIRDDILASIGPKAFNKLLASVEATRRKGRLRYWQEPLVDRLVAAGLLGVRTVDAFVSLFSGMRPAVVERTPITRHTYLEALRQNPFALPLAAPETPPEWVAAAWEVGFVREAHQYDMARTVSKVGELAYDPRYLASLAAALTVGQQVELFVYIRDHGHREAEFRPGFEAAFMASVGALPPPLPEDE